MRSNSRRRPAANITRSPRSNSSEPRVRIPQSWSKARLTLVILVVTVAAWLIAVTLQREEWIAIWGGFIPARWAFGDGGMAFAPFWLTPLTSALIHAGFL